MRFAFKTAPQNTTWQDMLAVWKEADDIEIFESGWTFDHFYPIFSDPAGPCLEGWMTLAALAQATHRLRLGTLVTGIHYRHPAVLANMAATLDIVSGGRVELGIGAGWNEEESGAYGIELGSPGERSDRFEEACQVIVGLLSEQTTDFAGKYYQLSNARCEPEPCSGRTRRSVSAAAVSAARYAPPRASRSTGTLSAARPKSSRASATCFMRTAATSAGTPRKSCCRATSGWARAAIPGRPRTPQRPWANMVLTWRSSCSRHRTTPASSPRSPRPSPSCAEPPSQRFYSPLLPAPV
jgi:alkanesulfonate monooxygenase SsuD/methylene tetrahydromethanopterin reductase-like flavin-dependent oxidoreductase (luciferase family)